MNHKRVVKTTDRPTTPYCAGPHIVKHIHRVVPLEEENNAGTGPTVNLPVLSGDAVSNIDGQNRSSIHGTEDLSESQFKRQLVPGPELGILDRGYGFSKLGTGGYDVLNTHLHFAKDPIDPSRRVIAPHIMRYYRIKELLDQRKREKAQDAGAELDTDTGLTSEPIALEDDASHPLIKHLSHFRRHSDTRAIVPNPEEAALEKSATDQPASETPKEERKQEEPPVATSSPQSQQGDFRPMTNRRTTLLRRQQSGSGPPVVKSPRQLLSLQRSHGRHKSQSFIQTSSSGNSMPSNTALVAPLKNLQTKPLVRAASSGAAYYAAKKLRIMTHHKRKCSISPPPSHRYDGTNSYPSSTASSAIPPSPALSFLSSIAERTTFGLAGAGLYEEGDEIGPYTLGAELGVGAFSRVYVGYRNDLDDPFNVGSLPDGVNDSSGLQNLSSESITLRPFSSAPDIAESSDNLDMPSGVAPPALMESYGSHARHSSDASEMEPNRDMSSPLPPIFPNSVGSTGSYSVNLCRSNSSKVDSSAAVTPLPRPCDTENTFKQRLLVNEMAPKVRKCAIKIVSKPQRRSFQRPSSYVSDASPPHSFIPGGSLGRHAASHSLSDMPPFSGSSTGRSQFDSYSSTSPSVDFEAAGEAEADKMERDTQRLLDHEITIWSNLHHPNIVEMYGVLENDEATFVLAELCEGGSLLDYISRAHDSFLPEAEAKRLFAQLASAVNYLHNDRGLVHRDIKLENIFLTGDGTLKLGDMGLSDFVEDPIEETSSSSSDDSGEFETAGDEMEVDKDMQGSVHSTASSHSDRLKTFRSCVTPHQTTDLEPGSVSLTDSSCMTSPTATNANLNGNRTIGGLSNQLDKQNSPATSGAESFQEPNTVYAAGSVHYCAPEELSTLSPMVGASGKNFASDIWSMACVLWAMLTGGIPFNDDFLPRLQMSIIHAKIPWHQLRCCQNVSAEAEMLLRHCFEPNPATRYDINQVLDSEWLK